MKALLTFLVLVLAVCGVGAGVWLYYEQDGELHQARTAIARLQTSLNTAQSQLTVAQEQLSSAQAKEKDAEKLLEAEKAKTNSQQIDLSAAITKVAALEQELEAIKALLSNSQGDVASEIVNLNTQLAKAKEDLAVAISAKEAAIASLAKANSPRHFYSVEELQDWLERDDTNTNPAYNSLGLADKAFILQIKALRDGFILSAAVDADSDHIYSWNVAIIGAGLFVVNADTDEVFWLANFEVPPIQPPLP